MSTPASALKKLGFTVLQGAAFGLGLVALLLAALMLSGNLSFSTHASSDHPPSSRRAVGPTSDELLITNTKAIVPSPDETQRCGMFGQMRFIGTLENKGPDSERFLNIYADLFDEKGEFIFQCQKQFAEGIKSGEKQNFIIECTTWPKEVSEKYSTFRIYAKGA